MKKKTEQRKDLMKVWTALYFLGITLAVLDLDYTISSITLMIATTVLLIDMVI